MVRIGPTLIDTDSLGVEDLDILIKELRRIRARRVRAASLAKQMEELVATAKEEGFTFIEKDFGHFLTGKDYVVYDDKE